MKQCVHIAWFQRGEYDSFEEGIAKIFFKEDEANKYAKEKNAEKRPDWDDTYFWVDSDWDVE